MGRVVLEKESIGLSYGLNQRKQKKISISGPRQAISREREN